MLKSETDNKANISTKSNKNKKMSDKIAGIAYLLLVQIMDKNKIMFTGSWAFLMKHFIQMQMSAVLYTSITKPF